MTKVIGTARVLPTATGHTIELAPALEAALPVEVHPAWCISADLFTTRGFNVPCGDHLGEAVNIPATDGDFEVTDRGALFPRIEVAPATIDGDLAVSISLFNPLDGDSFDWVATNLRPADARKLAADMAPLGQGARGDAYGETLTAVAVGRDDGVVSVATDGGSVRLAVVGIAKKLYLSAFLKPDEADHMVSALIKAADEVQGR